MLVREHSSGPWPDLTPATDFFSFWGDRMTRKRCWLARREAYVQKLHDSTGNRIVIKPVNREHPGK
jgi:hypothetical protein